MDYTRSEIEDQLKEAGQHLENAIATVLELRSMLQQEPATNFAATTLATYTLPGLQGWLDNDQKTGSLKWISQDLFEALGPDDPSEDPDYVRVAGPFATLEAAESHREIEVDEAYEDDDGRWSVYRHVDAQRQIDDIGFLARDTSQL